MPAPNKAAHHPHIPPAATAPPTTARRAYPSTTRPTTAASTPPSNGTANAGEDHRAGKPLSAAGRAPRVPLRGREYASRWEGPLRGEKQPEAPRPTTPLYPRAHRMRDTINHHSRPAAGMSLPTSTHSDTTKSRYWVTTTRPPVVETTPPTQAPSGRVLRCRSSTQSGNRAPASRGSCGPACHRPAALSRMIRQGTARRSPDRRLPHTGEADEHRLRGVALA